MSTETLELRLKGFRLPAFLAHYNRRRLPTRQAPPPGKLRT